MTDEPAEKRARFDRGSRDLTPVPLPEPLGVEVVDSHTHLDLLEVPVEQAVADARAVGVTRLLTIGIDVATSTWSADVAASYDGVVYAGVAIHPNEAFGADDEALRAIERLAALPQVRAVGETGLDWFRMTGAVGAAATSATREQQEASFRAHIAIAKAVGKPVMIHDRDAHDDILRVLEEEGPPETVVFHCFSGDAEFARRCADRGYVLSFAGTVTFKNGGHLREALSVVPLDLVLVETDAPFLAPTPWRGRPNAPYLIPTTVRAMAEVRGVDEDTMATAVADNAARCFGPC